MSKGYLKIFSKTLQIIINVKNIHDQQQVLNEVKDLMSSRVILVGMLHQISIFQNSYSCFYFVLMQYKNTELTFK